MLHSHCDVLPSTGIGDGTVCCGSVDSNHVDGECSRTHEHGSTNIIARSALSSTFKIVTGSCSSLTKPTVLWPAHSAAYACRTFRCLCLLSVF